MASAILIRNKEGVLAVFEKQGRPAWSLWETKAVPSFSCNSDDEEDRLKELTYYLDIIKDSNSTADFTIKFHEDTNGRKITNNTPVTGSMTFKLNSSDFAVDRPAAAGANGNSSAAMLNELFASKLEMLDMKWQHKFDEQEREHQEELDELEEELEDKKSRKKVGGTLGMIGEAGEQYPWMQDIIKDVVGGLKENLKDIFTVAKHKMRSAPEHEPAIGKVNIPNPEAPPVTKMKEALDSLIMYNAHRFGWPEGMTDEQKENAPEGEKEAARKKGYAVFADTLAMLCNLCQDDDMYDLAIKKLKAL